MLEISNRILWGVHSGARLFCFLPVEFLVYLAETFVGDVGIDLGRGDGGMSEHGLYRADIGAVVEEIRREAVSERVRMHVFDDTRFDGTALHQPLHAPIGEAKTAVLPFFPKPFLWKGYEQCRIHVGAFVEVAHEGVAGGIGEEDDPELGSLAAYAELSFVDIYLVPVETRQLGDTETGGEEELEDGAVPAATEVFTARRFDKALHFLELEEVYLPIRNFAHFDFFRGDGVDILFGKKLEKRAQDDDMVYLGRLAERSASGTFRSIEEDSEFTDPVEGNVFRTLGSAPSEKFLEGALIVCDGPRRATKLDLKVA